MKLSMSTVLGAVLALGCASPAFAHARAVGQYQDDGQATRQRNTQAYSDGFAQGQADARSNATRNDAPTSQWTQVDDQQAYRQGYDAGYAHTMNSAESAVPGQRMGHGDQQAGQFGYQDGLAAGREDQMKGKGFRPQEHELYKHGDHGWTSTLGTKDQFKQIYREGFMKG